jgi:cytochrome c
MAQTPPISSAVAVFVALAMAPACGSSSAPEPAAPAAAASEPVHTEPAEPAALTFAAQVERGAGLYAANCAGCHGDGGQGTAKGPAVVGDGVLPLDPPQSAKHRKVQFKTALDVFLWVKQNMPAGDPGSLTDDEYVAILAFDLKANGVELDEALGAESAAKLELH